MGLCTHCSQWCASDTHHPLLAVPAPLIVHVASVSRQPNAVLKATPPFSLEARRALAGIHHHAPYRPLQTAELSPLISAGTSDGGVIGEAGYGSYGAVLDSQCSAERGLINAGLSASQSRPEQGDWSHRVSGELGDANMHLA